MKKKKICKTDSLPQFIEYIFIAQLCQQNDNLFKLKIWTKSLLSNSQTSISPTLLLANIQFDS